MKPQIWEHTCECTQMRAHRWDHTCESTDMRAHMWDHAHESTHMRADSGKHTYESTGEGNRSQDWETDFLPACAVETHMEMSQEPFCVEIYRKMSDPNPARGMSRGNLQEKCRTTIGWSLFARACAIETHVDISEKPFRAVNYRKNADPYSAHGILRANIKQSNASQHCTPPLFIAWGWGAKLFGAAFGRAALGDAGHPEANPSDPRETMMQIHCEHIFFWGMRLEAI